MPKTTKIAQVKKHLKEKGSITSWEAIRLYGSTRLSDIIFKLRKLDWNIETVNILTKDRNDNSVNFAKYIYKTKPKK